jgi:hypothetical protein
LKDEPKEVLQAMFSETGQARILIALSDELYHNQRCKSAGFHLLRMESERYTINVEQKGQIELVKQELKSERRLFLPLLPRQIGIT